MNASTSSSLRPSRPVGILALQGDFPTHRAALERAGLAVREVRDAAGLEGLDGFVLPGGESTVIWKLMEREGLTEPLDRALRAWLADELPILATCAGVVLLARRVTCPEQASLAVLALDVERNAYGRQLASGTYDLVGAGGFADTRGTFIRAPRIACVDPNASPAVDVLARRGDDPVLVQQGSCLAATFHPELDDDHPAYRRFVDAVHAYRVRVGADVRGADARGRPAASHERVTTTIP